MFGKRKAGEAPPQKVESKESKPEEKAAKPAQSSAPPPAMSAPTPDTSKSQNKPAPDPIDVPPEVAMSALPGAPLDKPDIPPHMDDKTSVGSHDDKPETKSDEEDEAEHTKALVEEAKESKKMDFITSTKEDIYVPPGITLAVIKAIDPILEIIHPLVMDEVDITDISRMSKEAVIGYLRPIIRRVLEHQHISMTIDEQDYFETRLLNDITGLGPLEPILADETVSDILVNGATHLYVERFGRLERCAINFRDDEHVMNVLTTIVSEVGRRVDETIPYVDARLKDGSRVNAIIHPLAIDGPSISIRKFKKQKIKFEDMMTYGSISEDMAKLLAAATQARLNILIVGGTGSGKTTMLNAISSMINSRERIVTIEDSAELQLQQPHVVRLETRNPNIEGKGEVTQRQLVMNALRMRPDRVILGEIRGSEAFDMLQAMNTGHDGSMCTIHASAPREVPPRLANMVMMSGYDFPAKAILQQIASSVNLLVQVDRQRDGKRRCTHITEVVGLEGDVITMQDLFTFQYEREDAMGNIVGSFKCSEIMPHFYSKAVMAGVDHILKEIYHG